MKENQSSLIDVIDDMCDAKNALFHMVRNVKDIMTCNVKTLTLDDTIQTCLEIMTENNIRHIPVLEIAAERENKPYFVASEVLIQKLLCPSRCEPLPIST